MHYPVNIILRCGQVFQHEFTEMIQNSRYHYEFPHWEYNSWNQEVTKYQCTFKPLSRHTLVSNKIADHSDVAGALPVSADPTKSSFLA